jgi:hypothetical protein
MLPLLSLKLKRLTPFVAKSNEPSALKYPCDVLASYPEVIALDIQDDKGLLPVSQNPIL